MCARACVCASEAVAKWLQLGFYLFLQLVVHDFDISILLHSLEIRVNAALLALPSVTVEGTITIVMLHDLSFFIHGEMRVHAP